METATQGWYRDPADDAQLRWWDGSDWTDHRRDVEDSPAVDSYRVSPSADAPPVYDLGSADPAPVYDLGSVDPSPVYDLGSVDSSPVYDLGFTEPAAVYDLGPADPAPAFTRGRAASAAGAAPAYSAAPAYASAAAPTPRSAGSHSGSHLAFADVDPNSDLGGFDGEVITITAEASPSSTGLRPRGRRAVAEPSTEVEHTRRPDDTPRAPEVSSASTVVVAPETGPILPPSSAPVPAAAAPSVAPGVVPPTAVPPTAAVPPAEPQPAAIPVSVGEAADVLTKVPAAIRPAATITVPAAAATELPSETDSSQPLRGPWNQLPPAATEAIAATDSVVPAAATTRPAPEVTAASVTAASVTAVPVTAPKASDTQAKADVAPPATPMLNLATPPRVRARTGASTFVALLPMISLMFASSAAFTGWAIEPLLFWGVPGVMLSVAILVLVLGHGDRRALRRRGFQPPSWSWLVLSIPGYFIARSVTLGKDGARDFRPMIIMLLGSAAGLAVAAGLFGLATTTTPSPMTQALIDQLIP